MLLAGGLILVIALASTLLLRPWVLGALEPPGAAPNPTAALLTARDGLRWWAAPLDARLWPEWFGAWPKWLALGLAFLVGLIDDLKRGGLSPLQKVTGQLLAAAPLFGCAPPFVALGFVLFAVAAMNVFNTYDNADRTASSLGALGFALWVWPVSVLLVLFLPFNRSPMDPASSQATRRPAMYLGDSGSHLLGMLFVVIPGAWLFLLVPALDLTRVVRVRLAAGDSPFEGDRRHLAHLLLDRGLSAHAMAFAMLALSVPLAVGVWGFAWGQGALWLGCGAGASVIAFVLLAGWANPALEKR